ncbi:RHS repeat domain-containing protein [Polyangium fumosum]|uniref:Teneurin-like YD-shell domain-containing protein n=1 Tax=Polyangium fumosum TaxID=889272 RepID=A0A4V6WQT3_9BACT|nr:RHS repeat-associated core domain-containing protein [Polyangium fumosum]TKD10033.1 hypothetical protein E8A74_10560 [Polyangium fumosum]
MRSMRPRGRIILFERDALGRVVRELQGSHVVERRYDARGLVAEVSSSLGFDGAFLRDDMGELDAISLGTGVDRWRTSITRDVAGLEAERRLPGGIAVRTRRDRIGRVAETSMLDGTDELRRVAYTWEPGSLLKERDDSRRGLTRYFHDQRARLTAAAEPSGRVRWRRPTATGNIQPAIEGEPRTYKKGGALIAADGVKFEYDRDGNRAAKVWPDGRREKYTWNASGRLVGITKPDGKVVRFEYDALGRRVKKISDAEERVWVWDGDVPLHELSTSEGPIAWVFEPGTFTLAAKVQGLRRWAIVTDQVGAPCAVFDEWGGVAWQGEVDVYGKAAAEGEKTAVPWRFPGQYEDVETGLYYNRFRYYDPEMGAYVSKDPIGLLGGLGAYVYVEDPLAWLDPLGLYPIDKITRQTRALSEQEIYDHFWDRHASELLGRRAMKGHDLDRVRAIVDHLRQSNQTFYHQLGRSPVIGHFATFQGRKAAVFFFRDGDYVGQVASAFFLKKHQIANIVRKMSRCGP